MIFWYASSSRTNLPSEPFPSRIEAAMALTSSRPFSAAAATASTRLKEAVACFIRSASSIGASTPYPNPDRPRRADSADGRGRSRPPWGRPRSVGTIRAVASRRTRRMEPLVEPEAGGPPGPPGRAGGSIDSTTPASIPCTRTLAPTSTPPIVANPAVDPERGLPSPVPAVDLAEPVPGQGQHDGQHEGRVGQRPPPGHLASHRFTKPPIASMWTRI